MAGTKYSMQCVGKGNPRPSLQWKKVGETLPANVIISEGALHFPTVTSSSSGRYRCFGKNRFGRVFAEVQMNVEGWCEEIICGSDVCDYTYTPLYINASSRF